MRRQLVLALGFLGAFATVAAAGQQPPPAVVAAGEEVIVTHAGSGQEIRGRLIELSSTNLAILADGRRIELPIDDVLRIDGRKDSLKNGAIIGASIMAGMTALSCPEMGRAGTCAGALIFNTGFGALVGAGVDALHKGRSPIYIKATRGGSSLLVRLRF